MARYLYSELATLIQARRNCANGQSSPAQTEITNPEWFDRHSEMLDKLVAEHLPHGAGFDAGTSLDLDASHADKLVFTTAYHHMNESGFYDGWTEHTITVTPSLAHRYNLRISGRNRNDIKEVINQDFSGALDTDVTYDLYREHFPELQLVAKWENEDGTPSQCYQAWYVGEKRFWNRPTEAREFAGQEMYKRWMSPR